MHKNLYLVYDRVGEQVVGPVISCANDMVARRTFQDAVLGEGSILGSHPEDYVLLKIGSIDEGIPMITGFEVQEMISGQQVIDLQTRFDKRMEGANDGS